MARLVRRFFALLIGLAMVGSASWLAYDEFFAASYINPRMMAVASFLLLIGGYILWAGVLFPAPQKDGGAK
jgi:hypothetical protein